MILVADDDVRLQKEMSGILGRAGWATLVVGDGREVVDAVRSREFDLIFLDVAMPGLNGLEALRILRRLSPETKVCMLTALDRPELLIEATGSDIVGYLSKPITATDVLTMVERWCPSTVD